MSEWTVQFIDVGRSKRSWSATFPKRPDEFELSKAVKRSGACASRGIDCTYDVHGESGFVSAGMHVIGRFSVKTGASDAS